MLLPYSKLLFRIATVTTAFLTIIFGYVLLTEVRSAGFPFGDATEYDQLVKTPFTILAYMSMASSVYFFYLGLDTHRGGTWRRFIIAISIYCILFFGLVFGIECYLKYWAHVNHGQGG